MCGSITDCPDGDPVNTENGDFAQSDTDLSIPTFGPSLDFTRTYDALAAQQQTQAGTPGPLGYGWTDNWASSLTQSKPVPADSGDLGRDWHVLGNSDDSR